MNLNKYQHTCTNQAAEVVRRQLKSKEAGATADSAMKLQNAESKLSTLKSIMLAVGKEATAAMMSVEVQQQRLTFERLLAMVLNHQTFHGLSSWDGIFEWNLIKLLCRCALMYFAYVFFPERFHFGKGFQFATSAESNLAINVASTTKLEPYDMKGIYCQVHHMV